MYLSTLRGSSLWNDLSTNGSLDGDGNSSFIPQGYTIEYGDRLYGNSELLEGSAIATVGIGKPVTLKYNVNNSQSTTQTYPDETVHYDQEFLYDINSFPVPVAPNYKIKGWYTRVSGGTKVEIGSNVAEAMGNSYSSTLTLYAQWEDKIIPAASNFSISPEEVVYDGKNHEVSVLVKSDISGMGDISSIYYDDLEEIPKNAGVYSISIDIEEGDSFASYSKLKLGSFTIKKAEISVLAQDKEITYGMEVPALTFEYGGFAEGESFEVTATLSCGYVKWWDIGEYDINVDVSSMALDNYYFTGVLGKLKVNKGNFDMSRVTLPSETFIYDSNYKSLSIQGILDPGVSVSYNNNSRKDVGSKEVEAIISVNSNYNDIPYPENTLKAYIIIKPATIIIIPSENQNKLYGEKDPEFRYSVEGNVSGESIEFLGCLTREKGEKSGKYNYKMGSLALKSNGINSNYVLKPKFEGKTFEIREYLAKDIFANINGDIGDDEWYVSVAQITAPDGFLISFDNDIISSIWSPYVTKDDGDYTINKVKYYLRRIDSGAISVCKEIEYKQDTAKPLGEIVVSNSSWKEFLNNITFGLFFKDKVDVYINVSDNASGIKYIKYYKSSVSIGLEEVEAFPEDFWIEGDYFSVEGNEKFIVYSKIQDNSGNITYLSSDGIIMDSINPSISGVENGKIYYAKKNIMIWDDYLSRVEINGSEIPFEGNSLSTFLTNDGTTYRIVAWDKSENMTDYTVVLKNVGILEDEVDKSKDLSSDENIVDNMRDSILKIDSILKSEYMDFNSKERAQLKKKREQLFNEFKELLAKKSILVETIGDAPNLNLNNESVGVLGSLFTNGDANNVFYGNDVKIVLEISPENKYKNIIPIEQHVPQERRIGYYMDISLVKYTMYRNGKVDNLKIDSLNDNITIRLNIPENLLYPSNNRNFSVYKLHGGEAITLNDIDRRSATITFETDKFSTFAISYFDESSSWKSSLIWAILLFIIVLFAVLSFELKLLKNKIDRN